MAGRCGGRISRPLLYFCAVAVAAVASAPAQAQSVPGWRLHASPHFLIYTVDGTPGARDVEQVTSDLELLYSEVIAPLGLPPARLIYPLYPSLDRFRGDWWYFATLGYGDLVHAWGAIYAGDFRSLTPYTVTRAAVSDAFPRAIPLLRWGLGEALGDRASGVDSHGHLRAALASGQEAPPLAAMLAPSDFGAALPMAYPAAVSFVAYLIDRYGLPRTAAFVETVSYRYFDFADLFWRHFGDRLDAVEQAWRARVAGVRPIGRIDDPGLYLAASRFVFRVTLAGNPARLMLLPDGPVVVSEAFNAVDALRRLDLGAARGHMERAQRATEQAERSERRTETGLRAVVYAIVLTPILLALGWLLWPTIRARVLGRGRGEKAGAGRKTGE